MQYVILPLSENVRQVFSLSLSIDDVPFYSKVEVRYLPAMRSWVLSIWDQSSGELLVNMIPLVCSYGEINDLLGDYKGLRSGAGLGSLFVIRAVDSPATVDPSEGNLLEFKVLWGDTYDGENL